MCTELFAKYHLDHEMKDQMHRTCSAHRKHTKCTQCFDAGCERNRLLKGMWHLYLENVKLDPKEIV